MHISEELTDGFLKLTLKGEFTVQYAEDIKSNLLQAVHESDSIELCISDVTNMDISGLQIICSTHRTMKKMGKQFSINPLVPSKIKEIIKISGFYRQKGCLADDKNFCPLEGVKNE